MGNAQAASTLSRTLPVTAPTTTLGTIRQVRMDQSTGDLYILGSSLSGFGRIGTDRSTYSNISYDTWLPNHSNSDLAVSNGHAYIVTGGTSNTFSRYDVSGTTASYFASSSLATGTSSITRGGSGSLYVGKGTNLYQFDGNLTPLSQSSASTSITRLGFGGDQLYYLSSTGRYTSSTPGVAETLIVTGGPSSATVKGFVASGDGSALYYASTSGYGKVSAVSGATYWIKSISNIAGMDIDATTGEMYLVLTSGTVYEYSPIGPVSAFTASASGTNVTLDWTTGVMDGDFAGVTIRRSTASFPTSPTDGSAVTSTNIDVSFTDTGLSEATYYYSIFNETTDGYFSIAATSTATIDIPPAAPSVTASMIGSSANLTWTIPAGTASFTLVRSTTGSPTIRAEGTTVTTTGADVVSFTDTALADGTYYYSLFATDGTGNDSDAGSASVTIDTTGPEAPTLTATASGSSASLTWNTPLSTTFFRLVRSLLRHPTSISDGTPVSSTVNTSLVDTGLADGTCYYSLFAADDFLNYSTAGTSTVTIDTTSPSAPSSFAASADGSSVRLTWSNPLESDFSTSSLRRSATGYPTSTTDGTAVTETTGTAYTDASLSNGTYYYSLFALDATGNASVAATASVTVRATTATGGGASSFTPPSSGNAPAQIATFVEPSASRPANEASTRIEPLQTPGSPISPASPPMQATKAIKPSTTFTRILRLGDRGEDVRSLQAFLNAKGFRVATSGAGSPGRETAFFGPATARAVKRFQEAFKDAILKPYDLGTGTGILGARMIALLNGLR